MFKATTSYLLLLILITITQIGIGEAQFLPLLGDEGDNGNGPLDFIGIATKYGHTPITYEVTTEDGYILTIYRLPGKSQYPLMLMHGIMDTSDTWFIRGENSLGVSLANQGYDVWCPNSRGNRYSRKHVYLDADIDVSYWDWSFHELGYYDLPAIIDKILDETNSSSVTAIGHSRGNVIFYVLGSTRPEYNSKVNLMVALAPICYFNHVTSSVNFFLGVTTLLNHILRLFNITTLPLFDYPSIYTKLLHVFCTIPVIGPKICMRFVIGPLLGYDPVEVKSPFVNVFVHHFPAGTSWKDVVHFAQTWENGEFAHFDYGPVKNLLKYKSLEPPLYGLQQITMPIALMGGKNDPLAHLNDLEQLYDELGNVVFYVINEHPLFTHMDFVWGKHMRNNVYPELYELLSQFNKVQNEDG